MSSKLQDVARAVVYPSYSIYRDFKRKRISETYRDRGVLSAEAGNDLVATVLETGKPAAIAKIGSLELEATRAYLNETNDDRRYRRLFAKLHHIAGIFPPTTTAVDAFSKTYLDCLRMIDVLAVWYNRGEPEVAQTYCEDAALVELTALEPYFHAAPWSRVLEGKRVLILHPFARTIAQQLQRSQEIWRDRPAVLPKFQASFITAPLSDALVKSRYPTWSVALEALMGQMDKEEFDIAIIGAGAFSLPLCVHAKRLGKIGVHLGGATQILFGVRGGRWDSLPEFHGFFNDAWVRPSPEETPENVHSVERGCYW